MLAAALTALLAFQDPAPATGDVRGSTPAPAVAEWNDREAKAAVDAFQKSTRGNASLADKLRALEELAKGSHKNLVKPLGSLVQSDKSVAVRRRAAELLGQQPAQHANPTIVALIRSPALSDHPAVLADLVRSLARAGYHDKQWGEVDGLFERDFAGERIVLQEAILDLATFRKEKQAVDLLLRNMDEPRPAWVDDPSNPPAEYWEARWKAWAVWRGKVKEALYAITGQRFSTAEEARNWLKKNPLK
jgi:hypothetical protein